MKVSPSQLFELLLHMIPARLNVLVVGDPGVGKSEIVAQAAEAADADLIQSVPSVEDPTVPGGLPWPDGDRKSATFLPFGNTALALAATKLTVWNLEDLGHATAATQAAYMQWLLARRLNGNVLPDVVTFVATTNPRRAGMGVSGILEPVKSRFAAIVELVPSLEDWIQNFALQRDYIPAELIAYHRFTRGEALHQFEPSADIKNYPCPRTWANVGKIQTRAAAMRADVARQAVIGAVGEARGVEYLGFLEMYRRLPTIEGILMDPDAQPVPTDPSALYAVTAALAARANDKNFGRVARYAERVAAIDRGDMAALMIRDATRRKPALQQTPEFVRLMAGDLGKLIGGEA